MMSASFVHFSTETYPVIDCEFVKKAWCLQARSFLNRNLLSYTVSLLRKHDVCKLVHVLKETYPVIDCAFLKKAWCLQACPRLKRNLPCHDSSGSSTSQTCGECPSVCVLNPIKEWLIYLNFNMRLRFSQHYWVYENCSGIVIWLLCVVQNL
jgi:hypothetical protein